jgi:hypothetical protein
MRNNNEDMKKISGHEVVLRNDSHEHDENECWIIDLKKRSQQ